MFDDILTTKVRIFQDCMFDSKGKKFSVGNKLGSNGDAYPDIECINIQNNIATFKWIVSKGEFEQNQDHITNKTIWEIYEKNKNRIK